MKINNRKEYNRITRMGQFKDKKPVFKAKHMKTGALCELEQVGDSITLRNGKTRFCNDDLSLYLHHRGVRGLCIIHHKSINFGVPKWLTYNVYNNPFEQWASEIDVYCLEDCEVTENEETSSIKIFHAETYEINQHEVDKFISELSTEFTFDGLLIQGKLFNNEIATFHLLPSRYVQGRVIDFCTDEDNRYMILEISHRGTTYRTKVVQFTNTMIADMDRYKNDLLDRQIKVMYSSFVPGDRIDNFTAPSGLFLINRPGEER